MTASAPTPGSSGRSGVVGVLVAQLGTPAAPTASALRPYLRQFLSDPRVVDLHPLRWWPILYGIVLTLRPARSARLYRNIWQQDGSPLMIHSQQQTALLQQQLGDSFKVVLGMRYGQPSIDVAVRELLSQGIDRIVLFPMFPQFSCATTGSVYDAVYDALQGRNGPWRFERRRSMPALRIVPPYYDHPAYIDGLRVTIEETVASLTEEPDRYLFTFHGIPRRYIEEGDPYRWQCEETARLLAESLELDSDRWLMGFQSRFGKEPWLEPYTEEELVRLGGDGVRRLIAACPGFTADCLETLDEIGREGAEQFAEGGGQELTLAPCLNAHPAWIDAMAQITRENSNGWA
jgi:ferrochelatase